MRKLTLGLLVCAMTGSVALAGSDTFSGKEMRTTPAPQPVCEWYRDTEWNVSLWGAYAFTGTENNRASLNDVFDFGTLGTYDQFLGGDHAWGGGADVKYFFAKYFGVGVQGFGLAAHGTTYHFTDFGFGEFSRESDHHMVGGALGTFTLRYPIGCSRFAPYVWAGGGGIFGGHRDHATRGVLGSVDAIIQEEESRAMGQAGGGLEVRITPHIGWIADFSWNVVDGAHNNFGMARSGINIAF